MRHLLDNQGPDQEYSEKNSRGPQLGLILLSLMIIRKHSHITNFCHLILKNKSFTFCHNRTPEIIDLQNCWDIFGFLSRRFFESLSECCVSTTLFILQAEKELKRRRTGSLDDEDEDEDEDEVDEGMDEGEGRLGR